MKWIMQIAAAGIVACAGCSSPSSSGVSKSPGVDRVVHLRNGSTESIHVQAYASCTQRIDSQFEMVLKPGEKYEMYFPSVPENSLPWAQFQVAGGTGKPTWSKFEGGEQGAHYTDGLYVAGTEPAVYDLVVAGGEVQAVRK